MSVGSIDRSVVLSRSESCRSYLGRTKSCRVASSWGSSRYCIRFLVVLEIVPLFKILGEYQNRERSGEDRQLNLAFLPFDIGLIFKNFHWQNNRLRFYAE